jgi:phospholipase A1
MKRMILSQLLLLPAWLHAAELEQRVQRCAAIHSADVRLSCYDALLREEQAAPEAGPAKDAGEAAPTVAKSSATPEPPSSRMVRYWELSDGARRGVFKFRPYRDNYLLLLNYNSSVNQAPFAGLMPAGEKFQRGEINYQLSFKMKLMEQTAGTPVDFWLGYSHQSFWQLYNRAASSPVRETNYQPELMAVVPVHGRIAGLGLRFVKLGIVHQSNGQISALSRSWNRVYAELGAERGDFAISARLWKRFTIVAMNDNPDIINYMGSGDVRISMRDGEHEYSVTARRNIHTGHGALQAGWAFPLSGSLKGYLQLFSGYGQSLIDYNYARKSVGAGILVDF